MLSFFLGNDSFLRRNQQLLRWLRAALKFLTINSRSFHRWIECALNKVLYYTKFKGTSTKVLVQKYYQFKCCTGTQNTRPLTLSKVFSKRNNCLLLSDTSSSSKSPRYLVSSRISPTRAALLSIFRDPLSPTLVPIKLSLEGADSALVPLVDAHDAVIINFKFLVQSY